MAVADSKPKSPFEAPQVRPARRGAANFWARVSDGLEMNELWRQFASEARASYGFYSKDVDWESIQQETGVRKGLAIARAFFWALVMKLTPARRVVLLLALALLVLGSLRFSFGEETFTANLGVYGVLLLLFLLALELADRVTMKRDLEIAREIQRWLVPERPPEIAGFDLAFATRPANTVAGDYYDVVRRETTAGVSWLVVVADVAGKSVPAALLMATFQASLQTLWATAHSLTELVTGLNRFASAHSLGGMRFTTAFVAELDPATRRLDYVSAGHNPAVLRRASGAIERLDVGGVPFGIDPASAYPAGSATLAPGDLLVIFTDGLVEAVNEKDEEFSDSRLVGVLGAAAPSETAAATQARVMAALDSFVGRARQQDDTTCLVLRAV